MSTATQERNLPAGGVVSLAILSALGIPGAFASHATTKTGSKVSFSVESLKHKESESGENREILNIITSTSGELTLEVESNEAEALMFTLAGDKVMQTGATATAEPIIGSATLENGDLFPFPHANVTTITSIVDSTPTTPVTLMAGTGYEIDPLTDMIRILDKTVLVGPLKATYVYGDAITVTMLTNIDREHFVRINTQNKANGNSKEIHEFYRVKFEPASDKAIKSGDVVTLSLKGSVLADPNKENNATYGQFGRVIKI